MSEEKKPRKDMTRRQFLGYTLGGVGGFLGAVMTIPMVRFAIDPAISEKAVADWVKVGKVSDFGPDPVEVKFIINQIDGWYQSKVPLGAWIRTMENGEILALSPICKHLGCTVTYEGSPDYPKEYFCPCHFGRYYINGGNVPGTPPLAPLDQYSTKVDDNGNLYLGQIIPNQVAES